MTKICKICNISKSLKFFEPGRCQCRKCRNIKRRAFGTRSGDGLRDYNLKRLYGITLEQFKQMLKEQDNKCYLCNGITRNRWGYGLAVDHCHKTGKVRKLLCDKCNKGLGQFNDDTVLLEKTITYLKMFKD